MQKFWNYHLPVWSPADAGVGGSDGGETGGDGNAAAGGETGQAPGGEGAGVGDPGSATGDSPRRSSIMDFAQRGQQQKSDGKGEKSGDGEAWKVPDGVEIPDHLVGASAEETLGKLATAYGGARRELSTQGKLTGTVPKDISGYSFDAGDGKDEILADLASEASQELLDPFREVALEMGLPDEAFRKFMEGGVRKMAEKGLQIQLASSAQGTEINAENELSQLHKVLGQSGAQDAINQIDTFGLKLADAGILTSQEDVDEFAQMFGTARATVIGQRMIVEMFGEKPIVPGDGAEGEMDYNQARAALEQANALPRTDPNRQKTILEAEERLAKASKTPRTTGQVRSSVLG